MEAAELTGIKGFGCCWHSSAKMHLLYATKTKQQHSALACLQRYGSVFALFFLPWKNNTPHADIVSAKDREQQNPQLSMKIIVFFVMKMLPSAIPGIGSIICFSTSQTPALVVDLGSPSVC